MSDDAHFSTPRQAAGVDEHQGDEVQMDPASNQTLLAPTTPQTAQPLPPLLPPRNEAEERQDAADEVPNH